MNKALVNIDGITELIFAYAEGNYSERLKISGNGDRDAIISGIHMLGEELESTTVSRDFFSNIFNAFSEMLWVYDENCTLLTVNEVATKLFQTNFDFFFSKNIFDLFVENHRKTFHLLFENKSFSTVNFDDYLKLSEDQSLPVNINISKILDRSQTLKGYMVIAKDRTSTLKQEEFIHRSISNAQEEERKRIANDLHDSLGQELNALKMYLNTFEQISKMDSNSVELFHDLKSILDRSINSAREISYNLVPSVLDKGDLITAIGDLFDKINRVSNCNFYLNNTAKELNGNSQNTHIYRITEEFVNNSIKHGNVTRIECSIQKSKTNLIFILEDNGSGFNVNTQKRGKGIYSMISRLKALSAIYIFESSESGTKLKTTIPYYE